MKTNPIVILCLLFTLSCAKSPESISNGEWHYDLLVNGVKAGKAMISNKTENGLLVSKNEMFIQMGTIKSSASQVVTETADFRPVKLEIKNIIEDSEKNNRQVITKTAEFKGNRVTLKSGTETATSSLCV